MNVEVLMSTMHAEDVRGVLSRALVSGPAVLVNQNDRADGVHLVSSAPRQMVIDSTERGLSKSRNLALRHATGEICLLADDDEVLHPAYEERIAGAFHAMPWADVIAFAVQERQQMRKPPLQSPKLRRDQLMKVSSVQIAFRLTNVREVGVEFDERLGAGAEFKMGEELAFLCDLHRAGLAIAATPIEIAHLEPSDSSWFTGYDEAFFRARGASFARAEPRRAELYALQWAVRKHALYRDHASFRLAHRIMRSGIRDVRRRGDQ